MQAINNLLSISSTDPDDQRRARLLNIMLMGVTLMTVLAIVVLGFLALADRGSSEQVRVSHLFFSSLGTLVGLLFLFFLNRYGVGWLASLLFLLLLVVVFALADEPPQVADGRTSFFFVIPILMASVLLRPWASFTIAGLCSVVIGTIAVNIRLIPNVPAILGFFVAALVSWLSARSLEQTLTDLRTINLELDQRVEERTHDLAVALNHVQAEANKNQAILESIADGVIVFDKHAQAIVANPSVGQLIGQSFDQVTDQSIEMLMGQDVDEADKEMVVSFLKGNDLRHSNIKFEWGSKTLSASFAPVLGAGGEVTGTVAVFRDFTREAEIDRMKSTFVSIASHELRTPLNAILGYAEMLEEGVYGPMPGEQRGPMGRIIANTGQLLSLANNLLDQAQIEAGKLALYTTEFSPTELTEGVQGVMEVLAQAKRLKLQVSIDEDVPKTIVGDQQRLHQMLINLAGNAIKFTQEGTVSIKISRPDQDHWKLAVADTGPGIPQDAQFFIFESFRQVDDTATREHRGAGLGLSIVKQLVTLMGGEISLQSEMGHGSTFSAILPLVPPQEETA